ncbi:MAG: hypothetical protein Q9205_006152 [Flavoplaca limonia]
MHIGDLTLVFTEYGRFAHEAQWREIREALNDFRRRFLYDATTRFPPPHPEFYMYASDLVLLGICRIPKASSGPNYLSGKEVAQALYTINGLFFDPGEKPRELSVEIMKSHVDPTFMSISWASMHNPWPQEPFSIQAAPNLVMDVYMYGRDFYPNRSFNERVAHDMDAIHDEITRETDDSRKPVRKSAYISGIVKLTIDPPTEAGQVLIAAWEIIRILKNMDDLIFGYHYGPRELGTHIRNQRGQALAKLKNQTTFRSQFARRLPCPDFCKGKGKTKLKNWEQEVQKDEDEDHKSSQLRPNQPNK